MNAADISTLDIGAWSELWNSLNGQSLGFTLKELMERFMGTGAMDAEGIWQRLIAAITGALKQNMLSYIAIIAVAFICAIVGIISAEDGAGGAGALVCAAIGTSAAAAKLSVLIVSAYGAMDSLCSCMELIAPVLSAAIAASGEAASSAALSPLAAFLSGHGGRSIQKHCAATVRRCGRVRNAERAYRGRKAVEAVQAYQVTYTLA